MSAAPAKLAFAHMSGFLERWFRRALLNAQGRACYICGNRFPGKDDWVGLYKSYMRDPRKPTFDHVTPRALNGPNDWRNLLFACMSCNVAKDDRAPHPCELLYLSTIVDLLPTSLLLQLTIADEMKARAA